MCFKSSTRSGSGWSSVSIGLLVAASQIPDDIHLIPNDSLAIKVAVPLPQSMRVVLEGQHAMSVCRLPKGGPRRLAACAQVSIIRGNGAESPGLVLGDCHIGQGAVPRLISKSFVCSAHADMSGLH